MEGNSTWTNRNITYTIARMSKAANINPFVGHIVAAE